MGSTERLAASFPENTENRQCDDRLGDFDVQENRDESFLYEGAGTVGE